MSCHTFAAICDKIATLSPTLSSQNAELVQQLEC